MPEGAQGEAGGQGRCGSRMEAPEQVPKLLGKDWWGGQGCQWPPSHLE